MTSEPEKPTNGQSGNTDDLYDQHNQQLSQPHDDEESNIPVEHEEGADEPPRQPEIEDAERVDQHDTTVSEDDQTGPDGEGDDDGEERVPGAASLTYGEGDDDGEDTRTSRAIPGAKASSRKKASSAKSASKKQTGPLSSDQMNDWLEQDVAYLNNARDARPVREKRMANQVRTTNVDRGNVVEEVQNLIQLYLGAGTPMMQEAPTASQRRTLTQWSRLATIDRDLAEMNRAFVVNTRSVRALRDHLRSGQNRIVVISSMDEDYLRVVAHALSMEASAPVKVFGELDKEILEALCEPLPEPKEGEPEIPEEDLPNDNWYLSINTTPHVLRNIDRALLVRVEKELSKRNMGFLIAVEALPREIPAIWQPYHIELQEVPPAEQLTNLLHNVRHLSEEQRQKALELARDETVTSYIDMELSYKEMRVVASLLADIARGEKESSLNEFVDLRNERIEVMLDNWIRRYADERLELDHLTRLIAMATLNRTSIDDVLHAADMLDKTLQFEIPEIPREIDEMEAFLEERQRILNSHPFRNRTSDLLKELMAERDVEWRNGHQVEVVKFRQAGFDLVVMRYIWREIGDKDFRQKLTAWLLHLLHNPDEFIGERAARILGMLADETTFAQIEKDYINETLKRLAGEFDLKDISNFFEALSEEGNLNEVSEKRRTEIKKRQRSWQRAAGLVEQILWWAYDPTNTSISMYTQRLLSTWADVNRRPEMPLYRLFAITCYMRVGIFFPDQTMKDVENIVRANHFSLKKVDTGFMRSYERKQERQKRRADNDMALESSTFAAADRDLQRLTSNRRGRKQQSERDRYRLMQRRVRENEEILEKKRQEQWLLFSVYTGSLSVLFVESTRVRFIARHDYDKQTRRTVRKTQALLLKKLRTWIENIDQDDMVATIATRVLSEITAFKVRYIIEDTEQSNRYKRWGLLPFVTRHDDKAAAEFSDILRYMLHRRDTFLRGNALHILNIIVQQVRVNAGDSDEKITKKDTFRYCQLILWYIAFERGEMYDRDDLYAHFRDISLDTKINAGKRRVSKLLAEYLNTD